LKPNSECSKSGEDPNPREKTRPRWVSPGKKIEKKRRLLRKRLFRKKGPGYPRRQSSLEGRRSPERSQKNARSPGRGKTRGTKNWGCNLETKSVFGWGTRRSRTISKRAIRGKKFSAASRREEPGRTKSPTNVQAKKERLWDVYGYYKRPSAMVPLAICVGGRVQARRTGGHRNERKAAKWPTFKKKIIVPGERAFSHGPFWGGEGLVSEQGD